MPRDEGPYQCRNVFRVGEYRVRADCHRPGALSRLSHGCRGAGKASPACGGCSGCESCWWSCQAGSCMPRSVPQGPRPGLGGDRSSGVPGRRVAGSPQNVTGRKAAQQIHRRLLRPPVPGAWRFEFNNRIVVRGVSTALRVMSLVVSNERDMPAAHYICTPVLSLSHVRDRYAIKQTCRFGSSTATA